MRGRSRAELRGISSRFYWFCQIPHGDHLPGTEQVPHNADFYSHQLNPVLTLRGPVTVISSPPRCENPYPSFRRLSSDRACPIQWILPAGKLGILGMQGIQGMPGMLGMQGMLAMLVSGYARFAWYAGYARYAGYILGKLGTLGMLVCWIYRRYTGFTWYAAYARYAGYSGHAGYGERQVAGSGSPRYHGQLASAFFSKTLPSGGVKLKPWVGCLQSLCNIMFPSPL